MAPFTIAVTADLHWGHRRGSEAVRLLASFLRHRPPDLLVLAGDLGTGGFFEECLALFADLPGRKALVPGNHDLWVPGDRPEASSLTVFEQHLPALARRYDF